MVKTSTVYIESPSQFPEQSDSKGMPSYIRQLPEAMRPQALQLLAVLHTNLDIERLLSDFSREIRPAVPHQSLSIDCPDCHIPVSLDAGELRHSLHVLIDGEYLCDLKLYGSRRLNIAEMWQLELWLSVLAYPLRNALQLQRMRTQVFRDPLTGVQNRIAMDQALAREVAAAHRHHSDLSLLVIDIDYFKSVNDNFGHSIGDMALKTTSQRIQSCLRDSDQIFRYGGEEFVVLLSHTGTLGAHKLAERIRREMAGNDQIIGDLRFPITVSIGVAELVHSDSVDSLFNKADLALYQAKESGRNRVCCHRLKPQNGAACQVSETVPFIIKAL
ncbi:MAG: GGDEF domain-containing protein [Gammaproteobacteria bacterium]|nr:GGDEF domain-containing protein [Gammaproteobacteria bacterium]